VPLKKRINCFQNIHNKHNQKDAMDIKILIDDTDYDLDRESIEAIIRALPDTELNSLILEELAKSSSARTQPIAGEGRRGPCRPTARRSDSHQKPHKDANLHLKSTLNDEAHNFYILYTN
jgi:hypothetical protein